MSRGPFGTVTSQPRFGFLTATTRIPATTRPGDYQVDLRCPDGQTATSDAARGRQGRAGPRPGDRLRRHGAGPVGAAADRWRLAAIAAAWRWSCPCGAAASAEAARDRTRAARRPGPRMPESVARKRPAEVVPAPAPVVAGPLPRAAAAPGVPAGRSGRPGRAAATAGPRPPAAPDRLDRAVLVFVGLFCVGMGLGAATGFDLAGWFRGPDEPPPREFPVLEPSRPVRLTIPSIKVEAPILEVGLAGGRLGRRATAETAQRGRLVRAAGPPPASSARR